MTQLKRLIVLVTIFHSFHRRKRKTCLSVIESLFSKSLKFVKVQGLLFVDKCKAYLILYALLRSGAPLCLDLPKRKKSQYFGKMKNLKKYGCTNSKPEIQTSNYIYVLIFKKGKFRLIRIKNAWLEYPLSNLSSMDIT